MFFIAFFSLRFYLFFLFINKRKKGIWVNKIDQELLTVQIGLVKNSQSKIAVEKILIKMQPLVKKYSRKMFFMEKEDANQELNLAIIEAINHIKKYDNEAMCLTYLQKSVIHKYYYLCKQNINSSFLMQKECEEIFENIPYIENFNNSELSVDIQEFLKNRSDKQKQIIEYIIFYELSDSEISLKMHISRQYVNRIKKKLLEEFYDLKVVDRKSVV